MRLGPVLKNRRGVKHLLRPFISPSGMPPLGMPILLLSFGTKGSGDVEAGVEIFVWFWSGSDEMR